jgi:hypothetical protein
VGVNVGLDPAEKGRGVLDLVDDYRRRKPAKKVVGPGLGHLGVCRHVQGDVCIPRKGPLKDAGLSHLARPDENNHRERDGELTELNRNFSFNPHN